MNLSVDKIREITTGAARIEESNGEICFFRYTEEQDALYKVRSYQELWKRSLCSAGIKLCFDTDSESLFLKIKVEMKTSRTYFSADVLKDGAILGYVDNIGDANTDNYIALKLADGEFAKDFQLGKGIKRICIRLPWNMMTSIKEMRVDDGSFVSGVKNEKILLAFGDSITQGYDALRSSDRYISKLADALGADEYNKAIGGDVFFPDLVALRDDFEPDFITVACGTNDWNSLSEDVFKENCRAFYKNLSENYPKAKIFALTPIWRADFKDEKAFGDFEKVALDIREATEDLENVTVIEGFDFVPHDTRLFSDKYLHPNSKGFEYYFDNLYTEIRKYI